MRRIALVLLFGLVAGCATAGARELWSRDQPGATAEDLARDRDACLSESIDTAASSRGPLLLRVDRDAFRACMERRGYHLVRS
jgi:hypothetical protein